MTTHNHIYQNKNNQIPHIKSDQEEVIPTQDNLSSSVERVSANPFGLAPNKVLQLQSQIGNQATMRLLQQNSANAPKPKSTSSAASRNAAASFGGLMSVPEEDSQVAVGGNPQINRTFGESVGDFFRPIGTGVGNAVGSVAAALTGIDINSSTNSGPTWNDHGHFDWRVGFTTTGATGWIVQEITNTYRAEDSTGTDISAGAGVVPHYWEAWAVDASSNITPNVGPDNDYWIRPNRGANTKGHWSMEGKVHFTTDDPALHGFTPGGVSNAGILLSATSSGGMDLGVARLHRYAQGTWDSTGAAPTHTGSAR